jgi:hypothetical protein
VQDFLLSVPSTLIQLRNAALAGQTPPKTQEKPRKEVPESDEELADALPPKESRLLVKPPPSSVDSSDVELDSSGPSVGRSQMGGSWVSLIDKQE